MSQQQTENAQHAFPVLRLRVLQIRIDDFEAIGELDADPAGDLREPSFGFLAVGEVERRPRRQLIEYRLQFDLLVDPAEFVDAFLEPFGDRQVEGLNRDAVVRLGCSLPAKE